MIAVDWFHTCEFAFTTSTHRVGLIGLTDTFEVLMIPIGLTVGFACQLSRIDGPSVLIGVEYLTPNGVQLLRLDAAYRPTDGRVQIVLAFVVPIAVEGAYALRLHVDGEVARQESIRVRLASAASSTDTPVTH